ncbi:MAG: metal-sensing transcriptional repressor [Candidatus Dojkabacteria bacterium]|nr:MAG: metal-sensing transcriptional repressor [Candidatus Dojkabacteria bacterium]
MKQEVREQLVNRLKRSEGQVKAVQRMIDDPKTEVKQILIQLSAVISSLENTKIALIEEHTKDKIMASLENLSDLLK